MTAKKESNVWIFQCNPKRWNLLNSLRKRIKGRVWLVNQYKEEIRNGDIAIIWMSGEKAGVYAAVNIISDPAFMYALPEDDADFFNEADRGKFLLRVKIDIVSNISDRPISQEEIKDTNGLEGLSVVKCARGTNFPVKKGEWKIIKKKIESL